MTTKILSEETQELLEEVSNKEDALFFIKKHGEDNFLNYYEDFERIAEEGYVDAVESFVEIFGIENILSFDESYQGQMTGEEFAEQIATDCGYIKSYQGDLPSWIEIDWKKSWDNLSYDYIEYESDFSTYIFSQNF